jgi:uncharacterized protein (TIGR03437 family)
MRFTRLFALLTLVAFGFLLLGQEMFRTVLSRNIVPATGEIQMTFTVTNENDSGAGSLRAAIMSANAADGTDLINFDPAFFNAPRTISLASNLPNITGSVMLNGPGANLLTIRRNINENYRILTIDAGTTVSLTGVTLSGGNAGTNSGGGILNSGALTITGCHITANTAMFGGGIFNQVGATLTLEGSTISNNIATGSETGGGISSFNSVTISNSTISGNAVTGGGGGNGGGLRVGEANIVNSTITNNSALGANSAGGLRVNNGAVMLRNTIIAANVNNLSMSDLTSTNTNNVTSGGFNLIGNRGALNFTGMGDQTGTAGQPIDPKLYPLGNYGGTMPVHALKFESPAIDKGSSFGAATDQRGVTRSFNTPDIATANGGDSSDIGAVEMQSVIVRNTNDTGSGSLRQTIQDAAANRDIIFGASFSNTARTITLTSGEIVIDKNLNIIGTGIGLLTLSGNNTNRIFRIARAANNATISDLIILNGRATGIGGGGILSDGNLTVNRCIFRNNSAEFTGGGFIATSSSTTFIDTTFTGNTAGNSTQGIGGAIYSVNADVTLNGCTINANQSQSASGIFFSTTAAQQNRKLRVVNTTISDNTATQISGGIFLNSSAGSINLEVESSTITANTGTNLLAVGIHTETFGAGTNASTTIRNSIIAGNSGPNLGVRALNGGGTPTITSLGYNLTSDNGGGFLNQPTDQINVNPMLGPLQNNGGPTQTHALLNNSPALDKGDSLGVTLDQRGRPRPFDNGTITPAPGGDNSDIGAVEMGASIVTNTNNNGAGSLRQAILDAPANGEILFDPGVFNIARTITMSSGEILINKSLTITGPGADLLTLTGNNTQRIFRVAANVPNATINDITIANGRATDVGGGIVSDGNLTLNRCKVVNNFAANSGGGVYVGGATAAFTDCTFSGNTTGSGTAGAGGAIVMLNTDATITSCTINGNKSFGDAGGIRFDTITAGQNRKLRVVNTTISGNTANANGGGMLIVSFGGSVNLEVVNSTITGNTGQGGGIRTDTVGAGTTATTTIRNSIIATNSLPNLSGVAFSGGGTPTITSLGYNLTSDNGSGFLTQSTDQINTNPLLGALQNNGGLTQTHALLVGSPALDKGSSGNVLIDQRGLPRPFDIGGIAPATGGDHADIGAVEMQAIIVTNANESGAGSLRRAVQDAPVNGDVFFDPGFFNVARTITLSSGEIFIDKRLTISGPGSKLLSISGNNTNRIFRIGSNIPNVTISDLTISNGKATTGGGIASSSSLTLTRCAVINNNAPDDTVFGGAGGGVFVSGRTASFTDCTFSGNTGGSFGGAIYIVDADTTISGCTINENSSGGFGGGIEYDLLISSSAKLRVSNSTISGNRNSSGFGGGLYLYSFSGSLTAEFVNNTITGNIGSGGAGILTEASGVNSASALTIRNSIIANEGSPNLSVSSFNGAANPTITSLGYNLSNDNGGGFLTQPTDQLNANPLLGPLRDNGGLTQTHALRGGSPALDKGSNAGLQLDQRGRTRPFDISGIAPATGGDNSDIGAVEMQASIVANTNDTGTGSLRQAIQDAPDNGEIIFDAAFFNAARAISITSAEISITKSLNITGPGANLLTFSGNNASRVINVTNNSANVIISDLTIANGRAADGGGGVKSLGSLTLLRCAIINNSAGNSAIAGGVYLLGATGTFTDCTFSGNSGGILGGGILIAEASATINRCTFNGNSAGGGGAIYYQGVNGRKLSIFNSTISGNTASTVQGGSGIYMRGDGTFTIEVTNSTIVNNIGSNGAIRSDSSSASADSTLTLRNNIIANNGAPNIAKDEVAKIVSLGYNLTSDGGGGFLTGTGDQINTNPLIGPLQDNGGLTRTHALLFGSPAIDKGNSGGLQIDQRGRPRPFDRSDIAPATGGDNSDIGAVEIQTGVVTNANDSGAGSLRQAVLNATENSDIQFDQTFFNVPRTISLTGGQLVIDKSLTINGPGAKLLTISGNNQGRIFRIITGFTASLSRMTLTGGRTPESNEGLATGGAIQSFGNLNLTDLAITSSTAVGRGGGVHLINANANIIGCTISGNTSGVAGGGISQLSDSVSILRIVNSTISGNVANGPGAGGGIFSFTAGQINLEVVNSTIVNNTAIDGGGIRNGANPNATARATIRNSIIANNTTTNLKTAVAGNGIATITSQGYNLSNDNGGGFLTGTGDQINANPSIGPLQNNGGPTFTHALLDGSPALDKGLSSGSTTDQRGVKRPTDLPTIANATGGDGADIGAFERGGLAALSASSFKANPFAQESIIAIFGAELSSNVVIASTVPLPTTLNNTRVTVLDANGVLRDAGLFFVSPGQVNAQIPPGTAIGPAIITVLRDGNVVATTALDITAVEPSLFTANSSGEGAPAAQLLRIRADGSQVFESLVRFENGQFVPAPINLGPESDQVLLVFYGLGIRNRSLSGTVTINIGNTQIGALYAGPAPGFIGLDQINSIVLPRNLAGRGAVAVTVTVEGKTSNTVMLNFQ